MLTRDKNTTMLWEPTATEVRIVITQISNSRVGSITRGRARIRVARSKVAIFTGISKTQMSFISTTHRHSGRKMSRSRQGVRDLNSIRKMTFMGHTLQINLGKTQIILGSLQIRPNTVPGQLETHIINLKNTQKAQGFTIGVNTETQTRKVGNLKTNKSKKTFSSILKTKATKRTHGPTSKRIGSRRQQQRSKPNSMKD